MGLPHRRCANCRHFVHISTTTVTLTLTGLVAYGETVTWDYAVPEENPLLAAGDGGEVAATSAGACSNAVPPVFVGSPRARDFWPTQHGHCYQRLHEDQGAPPYPAHANSRGCEMYAEKHSTRLTAEAVDSGSKDCAPVGGDGERG